MQSFCNLPANLKGSAGARLCQWPIGSIVKYSVQKPLPGFSIDDCYSIYKIAFDAWAKVSGFLLQPTRSHQESNVLISTRKIDGRYGILAEAELPCGNITPRSQLRMWFDTTDRWVHALNVPQGSVPVVPVARHEFGHIIGLGHNEDNITNALMDPQISHIVELQEWDIAQAVLRYGEYVSPGIPNPMPPPNYPGSNIEQALRQCLSKSSQEERIRLKSSIDVLFASLD